MYLVKFRTVKFSLDAAKRGFYRALNSIFGKIGHIASEEVILQLVTTKCIPIYGLEVLPIRQSQLRSLDFMINRLLMKLFKTSDHRRRHYAVIGVKKISVYLRKSSGSVFAGTA